MTCLFVFHLILFNLGTTHNLVLDCEFHSAPLYLLAVTIILPISALPYPFVVVSYVVSVMALGETFDTDSRHSLEMPLVFPILYLCFVVLAISYSCAKMVELHHPSFLLSMVLRPKRFVTTISVIDITNKAHIFTCTIWNCERLKISNKIANLR